MQATLRGFFAAILALWIMLCIIAYFYSEAQQIPRWVTVAVVPAFLLEAGFYAASGTPAVRRRLELLPRKQLAWAMVASAILPYLVYSISTGVFGFGAFAGILAMAGVASFWYVVLPPKAFVDAGYLAVLAMPVLLKVFPQLYADPLPKLQLFILGVLMWYRTGVLALLVLRRLQGIEFSFFPAWREWRIGAKNYLYFLPLGICFGLAIQFFTLRPDPFTSKNITLAAVTFIAILWVVAVAEEFFFRGFLQQLLSVSFHNETLGLLAASLLFGLAHLGFGHRFPNWRFAVVASVAGWFFGRAYMQARSIRASMVTHALVVTTWRAFFVLTPP